MGKRVIYIMQTGRLHHLNGSFASSKWVVYIFSVRGSGYINETMAGAYG